MTVLRGNYIFTQPGERAFRVASNCVNYFSLGDPTRRAFYLEARIENSEFLLSGRLYKQNGEFLCEIQDNRVKQGSGCKVVPFRQGGYEIRTPTDQVVFRARPLKDNTCLVEGEFYNDHGTLIAKGDDKDFGIFKGPAVLGRSGAAMGIVIGE